MYFMVRRKKFNVRHLHSLIIQVYKKQTGHYWNLKWTNLSFFPNGNKNGLVLLLK
jgi:hypothetical protein